MSNEFILAFKKLSKQDSTTKQRGLQELAVLFQSMPADQVKPVVQNWIAAFLRLSLANDSKIRVALHRTFADLLSVAKRSLAPHLKAIIVCHFPFISFSPFALLLIVFSRVHGYAIFLTHVKRLLLQHASLLL